MCKCFTPLFGFSIKHEKLFSNRLFDAFIKYNYDLLITSIVVSY